MDEFFSEMQRLRDAAEDKRFYDTCSTDDWNTLTSSMDALEDTHEAISAFVAAASKLAPKFQARELGEGYLRTYGVMQAFVIQQDAARNLHESLGMPKPDLKPFQILSIQFTSERLKFETVSEHESNRDSSPITDAPQALAS